MYDHQPSSPLRLLLIPVVAIFWIGIAVTVFNINPYLFTSNSLKEEIAENKVEETHPFPKPEMQISSENLSSQHEQASFKPQAPEKQRWSRKLALKQVEPLTLNLEGDRMFQLLDGISYVWSFTESLFQADTVDKDAESQTSWSFHFSEGEFPSQDPLISEDRIVLASNKSSVVTLEKESGRLVWSFQLEQPITDKPFLIDSKVLVPTFDSATSTTNISLFDLKDGTLLPKKISVSGSLSAPLAYNKDKDALFVATDDRELHAITFATGETLWKHTTPSPVVTRPTFHEDLLFINTADQTAYGMKTENPEVLWEYKLKGVAGNPFVAIPNSPFLAVLTKNGYLHTLNWKKGSGIWRFNTQSKASTTEITAIRLNNQTIEEQELKWRYKGWVIWAPCVENRICMFNPAEGNLVGRLSTAGEIASMPVFSPDTKRLTLLLKNVKDRIEKKVHKWGLGHYIELAQLKRELKKKEQERLSKLKTPPKKSTEKPEKKPTEAPASPETQPTEPAT